MYMQTELSDIEDLEEDEFESGFEDMKTDEEYEEELDPHSSKFRAEGQLMAYEEEPSFEGYLSVKVYMWISIEKSRLQWLQVATKMNCRTTTVCINAQEMG